jgi:hypothetical protein
MAHYDCDNCGHGGGVGFGYCQGCTPPDMWKALREDAPRNRRKKTPSTIFFLARFNRTFKSRYRLQLDGKLVQVPSIPEHYKHARNEDCAT